VLSRYFTPAYVLGAAHSDVLEALEEYESSTLQRAGEVDAFSTIG
jgi:hypothetical protein